MKQLRNPNGELYRVLLMLGICFFHAVSEGPYNKPWLANAFQCCVNGFAFLSGWYGIAFKPSKLVRLYGVGIYCGAVFGIVAVLTGIWSVNDPKFYRLVWAYMTDQWFFSAYVGLMLLAPAFNYVVEKTSVGALVSIYVPLLILFGWSWTRSVPVAMDYLPSTSGLGAFTALSLLASYLFARILRRFRVDERIPKVLLLIILLVTLAGTSIGFGEYSSPFATIQCSVAFILLSRLRVNAAIGNVVRFLGPSMFSVYLLHAGGAAYPLLVRFEKALGGSCPSYVVFLISAVAIFVVCVILDFPRRAFVRCFRQISGALDFIDRCYQVVLSRVVHWLEGSVNE